MHAYLCANICLVKTVFVWSACSAQFVLLNAPLLSLFAVVCVNVCVISRYAINILLLVKLNGNPITNYQFSYR